MRFAAVPSNLIYSEVFGMSKQQSFGIIYKATNLINNKCYIGQTVQKFKKRKSGHNTYVKNGGNDYFHNALKKHGLENFTWEILCEDVPIELLDIRETMKIIVEHSHYTENGYNLTWGGLGNSGWHHSNKTKKKIGNASKGRILPDSSRLKISKSNKGIPKSEEHKKKLSEANKGNRASKETRQKMSTSKKGHIVSEETKQKLSMSLKGNKNNSKCMRNKNVSQYLLQHQNK